MIACAASSTGLLCLWSRNTGSSCLKFWCHYIKATRWICSMLRYSVEWNEKFSSNSLILLTGSVLWECIVRQVLLLLHMQVK